MPEGIGGVGFLAIDFWAPLSSLSHFRPQARLDNPGNLEVVGRLKPGVTRAAARAGLVLWATQTASALPPGQRAEDIRVESTTAFPTDMLLGFSPLFIAFGLVLAIGCANVANLLLARALSRQREIGIRLSLGASRRRVIRQLLTESLLLAFVSAACALAISRVVLRGGLHALVSTMPPELAELLSIVPPDADLRVVGFLVVAAVISAAFFGVLPALHATRLDLVRAIRGDVTRDGRPKRRSLAMIGGGSYGSAGRARNGLIIAQVIASTLLLVCAGVFLRGALRAQAVDPGLRVADTIVVEFANKFRPALVAAVSAEPSVAAVVAAWPGAPLASRSREAYGLSAGTTGTPLGYRFVSHGYFEMFEIGVVAGRVFTEAECRSTSAVAVVSESVARAIWPNGNPVGQVLSLTPGGITVRRNEPALPSQALVVIGVVRDVPGFQMAWPEAGVYVPFDVSSPEAALIARAHGDPEPTRRALLRNLTRIDPNMHQVVTMRTLASLQTYPLQVGFWLTLVLGGLALVLTASGVYGVLSFLVVQRTKEFGVRVALGATTGDITRLVISQSLRVVAIGLAIGVGLAWAGSTALMATPVAEKITGIISVFDGVAYVGSLVFIVVASTIAAAVPAQRAARIDPIATLREE
jgi:predicted permease